MSYGYKMRIDQPLSRVEFEWDEAAITFIDSVLADVYNAKVVAVDFIPVA